MKRIIVISAAIAALFSSCTFNTAEQPSREITFQVANYSSQTKADPADYKDNYASVPFGSYAWFKGENPQDNADFFQPQNQEISYNEGNNTWAPTGTTYYWPKSGSIDFISYSPYSADGTVPAVTEDKISYPAWNVDANSDVDLMYADKQTGLNGNIQNNYFYDGGVPTLFHHALAKVAFKIKANSLSKTAETGDITRWEITVNSVSMGGILSTGTLDLNLAEDGTWTKPESNVWTPDAAAAAVAPSFTVTPFELTTEAQNLGDAFLVLPQLIADTQTVGVNVTIKTYRDRNDGEGEKLVLTETGVDLNAALKIEEIDRWGINQYIIYTLVISPYYTEPGTETDEKEPVAITFDPAVVDWDTIEATAVINL